MCELLGLGFGGPWRNRRRDQKSLSQLGSVGSPCSTGLSLIRPGALALKEHPDKAGIENKERFQEIQEASGEALSIVKLSVFLIT